MEKEKIVVLDFGGQYTQLIARCIREAGVYSEIYPAHTPAEKFADGSLKGIVRSGGPDSVYAPGAKRLRPDVLALGLPVIATDVPSGGTQELIRHGENGLIIPPGDEEALKAAMERLLSDGEYAERLGEQAHKIQERLAPERVNRQWQEYFESIL